MKYFLCFLSMVFTAVSLNAQVQITGFIYESGNRGYISNATVTLSNETQTEFYGQLLTDASGEYQFKVTGPGMYILKIDKYPHFDHVEKINIHGSDGPSVFLKHELKRKPGYEFEITLAEKDPAPEVPRDALKGAMVEVYNNTKKREELVIESLESPDFKVNLLKGNHYTILIRKTGFLSKRMEALVDVEGCILCFEGIGRVTPGVTDNLTEGNSMGVLLANVEMDRYYAGKVIGLSDIYYEYGQSRITDAAAIELNKVADFLKDNPSISVELGSHTDSRGGAPANLQLSNNRAKAAVEYLVIRGGIDKNRISAKGYGETQLVNNCSDGIDCTEEEHRLNRRTELKVIDIIAESGYRMLRQMKADELMDEILADLDKSGQIKIQEGEDIASAIAAGSESKPVNPNSDSGNTLITTSQTEMINRTGASNEEIIKSENDVADIVNPQVQQVTQNNATMTSVQSEDQSANLDRSISDPIINPVDQNKTQIIAVQEKIETQNDVSRTVTSTKIQSEASSTQSEIAEWIRPGDSENAPLSIAKKSKMYGPDYSGYKVVVIFSRYELPKEHSIFQTYDDVDLYTTADGNKLYMLGSFGNKKEAEAFMNTSLRAPYPHSYVVGFEKGIRIY